MAERSTGLARRLGLGQITASGVGIIIGAGIYVLLGAATAKAGAGVWIAFLVAGVLSALTALSYAELAAMFPNAGAEYDYTRRVAPPWVAFVVGWIMIVALAVAAAAVSLGFASYLRYFFDVPQRLGAFSLLGLVTVVALTDIEQSARLTVALSAIQIGGLVVIASIGLPHIGDHSLIAGTTTSGVVTGAALVFFAFVGFDEVITLAEETTNPARTIPKALLIALAISTVLYVAVAIAAVSVLGPAALAASEQPLADVMATAVGSSSAKIVAVVAMIATTNTTLLAITAASRLQYGMADTGALPHRLSQLNARQAPWVAIALAVAAAGVFVTIGDLSLVASVTDFAVYVVFIAVNVTVILLRFWQPNRRRPFTVPLTLARIPLPPVLALVAVVVMLPSLETAALALGVGLCILGVVVYVLLQHLAAPPTPAVAHPNESNMPPRTKVTSNEAKDVAASLRIDFAAVAFDLEQFQRGMHVELQHGRADPDTNLTNDDLIATGKIALAHLNEIPDYYTRLAAMTEQARHENS